ncbi:3'(2'),5'-bisphosphate nucleotidase CysQ [Shimia haliotis]|uniref:Myo-inositol-1(Or 4)-monophosphatase n=1 Tax=Shimia haliotis TaxID=1280847 RepID=A0A1I4GFD6_9RHOB|nr:3'(2'),5'-bisphosphate nucleotidase CysQ [Shimia haliotis]SFL27881.1 myo-inositol-1(or 4)-monophosphatase [Shimia haliotis]
MPDRDLQLLLDAANEAGRIATSYTGASAVSWDKPDGAGPVTEADLAVNKMLEATLLGERPDYGWLSEESQDNPDRLGAERSFIIDPIDGTRSFIDGSDTWAHSLAIADRGEVVAAVVFLPKRERLYAAAKGQGATLNGAPIKASAQPLLTEAKVLAARPVMHSDLWRDKAPEFQLGYRPSLAYRLALVAQGRFDAMLTLRPTWEWDIAAGDLILREAGAVVSDRMSEPLVFNKADPRLNGVVAGGAPLQRQICDALAPVSPL